MTTTHKILLVEDEVFLLDIYAETLTDAGYQVDTAHDGNIALEKMSKGGYDLVLLDIMLPGKDGQQILEHLAQNHPARPNRKILLTTNLSQDNLGEKFKKFNIVGHLIKSEVTPDQFLEHVKQALK